MIQTPQLRTAALFPRLFLICLSAMTLAPSAHSMPQTFIEMESTGSYVMPAGSHFYDESNSTIEGWNSYRSNSDHYQSSPTFRVAYPTSSSFGGYWSLHFSTHELGGPMRVGNYPNATRFPFEAPGTPGLAISGNGRGNNMLTGSFQVLDVAYSGNTLTRFAAAFEQNGAITGRIAFNSDYFFLVPEPSTALLFGFGMLGLASGRPRRDS